MIKKLRIKLILVSMLSLLAVLLAIVGGINLMNVHRMVDEADGVLDILRIAPHIPRPRCRMNPGISLCCWMKMRA